MNDHELLNLYIRENEYYLISPLTSSTFYILNVTNTDTYRSFFQLKYHLYFFLLHCFLYFKRSLNITDLFK